MSVTRSNPTSHNKNWNVNLQWSHKTNTQTYCNNKTLPKEILLNGYTAKFMVIRFLEANTPWRCRTSFCMQIAIWKFSFDHVFDEQAVFIYKSTIHWLTQTSQSKKKCVLLHAYYGVSGGASEWNLWWIKHLQHWASHVWVNQTFTAMSYTYVWVNQTLSTMTYI